MPRENSVDSKDKEFDVYLEQREKELIAFEDELQQQKVGLSINPELEALRKSAAKITNKFDDTLVDIKHQHKQWDSHLSGIKVNTLLINNEV